MIKGDGWGYEKDNSVRIIWSADGGHEWDEITIVRNERGEYALYADCGCSCNSPYESSPENSDLAWDSDLLNVIRKARNTVRTSYFMDADEKVKAFGQLSTLRYRENQE